MVIQKISNAAGVYYQIVSGKYDKVNSTIAGIAAVLNAIYYDVSDPTLAQEPTSKNYADTADTLMVEKDGSVAMTGDLNLN